MESLGPAVMKTTPIKDAKTDFNEHSSWKYSRYNYAVAFDADIYYMRITGRENEKPLESKAMEGFYDKYGAIPVGVEHFLSENNY